MIRKNSLIALCLLALACWTSVAHSQLLQWRAVDTDTAGLPILPEDIFYNVHYAYSDEGPYQVAFSTAETFADISGAPEACYYLRATAVRVDTTPPLESSPSNTVIHCVDGAIPFAIPQAPVMIP